MTFKVIKGAGKGWRPFRFPPRASFSNPSGQWEHDPDVIQRAIGDGFQQGSEKGYQQGLLQGQEEGHREGYGQGRNEGLMRGREEGRAEGRQQFELASQPLENIIAQLQQFAQQQERQRRQDLLELVKKVAQQVIRCELTLNPTQLLNLAEEAMTTMPDEQDEVQILLNPDEYNRIRDLFPGRAAAWRLVADENLAPGECRIVTPQAEMDIGCQQRLDACIDTLSKHMQLTEG
ncbi:MAG TPA: flagellar assembly protein FliH [Dongiaceae bacterium]|nr:flagellar assembly protein FliH [Dongiaceae bacterium]